MQTAFLRRWAEAQGWAAHRQATHLLAALHGWAAHRWATHRLEEQEECHSAEVAHPPLEEGHLLQVFLDCLAAMEAPSLEVSAVPACLSVLELEVSVAHPAVCIGQAVQPHTQVCLQ